MWPPKTDPARMLVFEPGQNLEKGDFRMAKKRFQAEQIIGKLREAEVEVSKGQTVGQVAKKLWITEQTYYLWRTGYPIVPSALARGWPYQSFNTVTQSRITMSITVTCVGSVARGSTSGIGGWERSWISPYCPHSGKVPAHAWLKNRLLARSRSGSWKCKLPTACGPSVWLPSLCGTPGCVVRVVVRIMARVITMPRLVRLRTQFLAPSIGQTI